MTEVQYWESEVENLEALLEKIYDKHAGTEFYFDVKLDLDFARDQLRFAWAENEEESLAMRERDNWWDYVC